MRNLSNFKEKRTDAKIRPEEIFDTIVLACSLQSSLRSNISLQTSVNIALLLLEDLETVQVEQINKLLLPPTS